MYTALCGKRRYPRLREQTVQHPEQKGIERARVKAWECLGTKRPIRARGKAVESIAASFGTGTTIDLDQKRALVRAHEGGDHAVSLPIGGEHAASAPQPPSPHAEVAVGSPAAQRGPLVRFQRLA
jgi:hypothetical protein